MSKSIKQFKETLLLEQKMYRELLKNTIEKTNILVTGKVKELEEITKKEQQYLMEMGKFEKIRRAIIANITEELNIREISGVSELLLFLNDAEAGEIDGLRNELLKIIGELADRNKLNEKLIRENLNYIDMNIEMLTGTVNLNNGYGDKAAGDSKNKINIFDMRI